MEKIHKIKKKLKIDKWEVHIQIQNLQNQKNQYPQIPEKKEIFKKE